MVLLRCMSRLLAQADLVNVCLFVRYWGEADMRHCNDHHCAAPLRDEVYIACKCFRANSLNAHLNDEISRLAGGRLRPFDRAAKPLFGLRV
jgi:hypothetical protein